MVLLPPSQAKALGGSGATRPGPFDELLDSSRREVRAALAGVLATGSRATLEKALKVRGPLLDRAIEASTAVVESRAPLLGAWQRYRGVVWTHLDPATLSSSQRRRILVPSGLYGITTAEDLIGDYRLTMNVSLAPLGGLASFWRSPLSTAVRQHVRGATVVNLLPREHEAAIDVAVIAASSHVVSVAFVGQNGAGAAGHAAKAVKGVVARRLLVEGLGALESFEWEGWRARHDGALTTVVAP